MTTRFEDWVAIQELMFLYAENVNLGRFDEVGEMFRHGRVSIEGNPAVSTGPEEVAAMYRQSTRVREGSPDSLLYTTNIRIQVQGDTATAHSYFCALHQKKERDVAPVVGGRYQDSFRRHPDGWAFEHRHMYVDLVGDLGDHISRPIEEYLTGN
jgi:ketosteroid isomerase-like protein